MLALDLGVDILDLRADEFRVDCSLVKQRVQRVDTFALCVGVNGLSERLLPLLLLLRVRGLGLGFRFRQSFLLGIEIDVFFIVVLLCLLEVVVLQDSQ